MDPRSSYVGPSRPNRKKNHFLSLNDLSSRHPVEAAPGVDLHAAERKMVQDVDIFRLPSTKLTVDALLGKRESSENLRGILFDTAGPKPAVRTPSVTPPSDESAGLLSAMTKRLTQLEKLASSQADALKERDREITSLKSRLSAEAAGPADALRATLSANERLRLQVTEMEAFLADYGLTWAGYSANAHAEPELASLAYPPLPSAGSQGTNTLFADARSRPSQTAFPLASPAILSPVSSPPKTAAATSPGARAAHQPPPSGPSGSEVVGASKMPSKSASMASRRRPPSRASLVSSHTSTQTALPPAGLRSPEPESGDLLSPAPPHDCENSPMHPPPGASPKRISSHINSLPSGGALRLRQAAGPGLVASAASAALPGAGALIDLRLTQVRCLSAQLSDRGPLRARDRRVVHAPAHVRA
jgi:hypothetical protein